MNALLSLGMQGWWSYEVCCLSHINQFHAEKNHLQAAHSLGEHHHCSHGLIMNQQATWYLVLHKAILCFQYLWKARQKCGVIAKQQGPKCVLQHILHRHIH